MNESRQTKIEVLAGNGNLQELILELSDKYNQFEIDIALGNAIAYSQIAVAEYLISIGADFSTDDYDGVYYVVHNNEIEGLKYAISKGVDININNGMLINCCIMTSINSKDNEMLKWLLENGANVELLTENSIKLVTTYGSNELLNLITH